MSENIFRYLTATALGSNLKDKGLISEAEYIKFDTLLCEKYGIPKDSLYRSIA